MQHSRYAVSGRLIGAPASVCVLLLVVVLAVGMPIAPSRVQAQIEVQNRTIDLTAAATYDAVGDWTTVDPGPLDPFAMVGLHTPREVRAEVRTGLQDGEWGTWTDMPALHDGPDPGSAEAAGQALGHWTHPIFTGPADRIQIRINGSIGPGTQAVLLDPFGLDRGWVRRTGDQLSAVWKGEGIAPASQATAQLDQPDIITREEWGANEAIVRREPDYAAQVDRAFIHHTVGNNGYSREDVAAILRSAQSYHIRNLGWDDLGYNFLVDRFGRLYEGRAGGLTEPVVGSQAGGFNTASTGIAFIGNFEFATPSGTARAGLADLLAWLADLHHFAPDGSADVTSFGSDKYAPDVVVTLDNILAHRDVKYTTCPGDPMIGRVPALREQVMDMVGDQIINDGADVDAVTVRGGRPDVAELVVSATLTPEGPWSATLTDPTGQQLGGGEGDGSVAELEIDLSEGRFRTGEYTYMFSSPDRRGAEGVVEFELPELGEFEVSAEHATADADGRLVDPVRVTGELYEDALWSLEVYDPADERIFEQDGQNQVLDVAWTDGATEPGSYQLEVTVDDEMVVSAEVEIGFDVFRRHGAAEDPIGAAALISGSAFPAASADRAVIARHDVFADALTGGPLAGADGPLLLTPTRELDERVVAELDRVLTTDATIYVLGGVSAVSSDVVLELQERYGDVRRLSGGTRIATAVAVAEVVTARSGTTTAMVARAGPDDAAPWADALAGGAYGAATGIPVLLSDPVSLSPETRDAISELGIDHTLVLGGAAAISDAVVFDLPPGQRLSGQDRAGTATAIATELWGDRAAGVVLANGYDSDAWAYALASAPISAREDAPLLLTQADSLPPATVAYLRDVGEQDRDWAGSAIAIGPERLLQAAVRYEATTLIR